MILERENLGYGDLMIKIGLDEIFKWNLKFYPETTVNEIFDNQIKILLDSFDDSDLYDQIKKYFKF